MDSFILDYPKAGQAIAGVTILAFMVERSLALIFEWDLYEKYIDPKWPFLKEFIALGFSFGVCYWGKFDAYAEVVGQPSGLISQILTGLLVAGGSKGAIKLVQGYLGVTKDAINADMASRQAVAPPPAPQPASPKGGAPVREG
jgi:hypothetical protein